MIKNAIIFFFTILAHGVCCAQQAESKESDVPSSAKNVEQRIWYRQTLSTPTLDYNLEPISDGHFKLIFVNSPSEYVRIKIYDIIGNLVLSEDTKYALNNEIEYNFNEKNSKIYVVKVESGNDNLTKKVNF